MEGFLNPQKVLSQANLRKDMVAVDFGSGSGGWTIPLAKYLEDGLVYAVDIVPGPLSVLEGKAKMEKISNIRTIKADVEEKISLPQSSADFILMSNLLFQVKNKEKVLEEGKRILRKEGKILVVDWKDDSSFGPKEGRISASDIKKIAASVDLKTENEFEASPYHWGIVLVK